LSPLYLMITAIGELLMSYVVDTSKFWVHERSDDRCQRFWWRNVLYIQNLFDVEDLCLNWTWSLACEMQYYIISTALLFVYAKNANTGKTLYQLCAAATFVFNMAITLMNHFVPSYDVLYNTGKALYIAPWARMSPYVVGVFFGWLLAAGRGKLIFTQKQHRKYWAFVCLAMILSMHSTVKRNFPFPLASTVMVLVRIFVAWSICWTVVATAVGYSNVITKILSCKFFIHTNKLTYGIYLINPLIITTVFGLSDGSIIADPVLA
ncbi:O-acyltransferase like protein-like, partial [Uranotaenia lowii]|uniref:O-acyltransferase like protein-like n=1 Tax=Uranotaenia lowii TaxID=190385 RepID=UPI00247A8D79